MAVDTYGINLAKLAKLAEEAGKTELARVVNAVIVKETEGGHEEDVQRVYFQLAQMTHNDENGDGFTTEEEMLNIDPKHLEIAHFCDGTGCNPTEN